jgi:hypothetical protein
MVRLKKVTIRFIWSVTINSSNFYRILFNLTTLKILSIFNNLAILRSLNNYGVLASAPRDDSWSSDSTCLIGIPYAQARNQVYGKLDIKSIKSHVLM